VVRLVEPSKGQMCLSIRLTSVQLLPAPAHSCAGSTNNPWLRSYLSQPTTHVIQLRSGQTSATAGRRHLAASSGNSFSSQAGSHTNSISTSSPCERGTQPGETKVRNWSEACPPRCRVTKKSRREAAGVRRQAARVGGRTGRRSSSQQRRALLAHQATRAPKSASGGSCLPSRPGSARARAGSPPSTRSGSR